MKFSKKKKSDDENKDEEKGIVESFLGGIPGFGNFFKALGRTEVFQKRFKDVNEKIEENLRKGEKRYVSVEGNISVRPLSIRPSMKSVIGELKKETSELRIEKDYVYGKKDDRLKLAVKVPKENVDTTLTGRNLLIKGDNFRKKIELPDYFSIIKKKQYKKGILIFELIK